jgi:hypothetical protein
MKLPIITLAELAAGGPIDPIEKAAADQGLSLEHTRADDGARRYRIDGQIYTPGQAARLLGLTD